MRSEKTAHSKAQTMRKQDELMTNAASAKKQYSAPKMECFEVSRIVQGGGLGALESMAGAFS
ncbi:MAG: hypothetical protein EBX40_01230 [Gammaproteobacteria bacterium]|nr:hypothetical protein [Gammaproteobacteria bacterium]